MAGRHRSLPVGRSRHFYKRNECYATTEISSDAARIQRVGHTKRDAARAPVRPLSRLVFAAMIVVGLIACQGPVVASNGVLNVANGGSAEASIHWQSGGFLGTSLFGASGTEPVAPCQPYSRAFPPGSHQITVTIGTSSSSFALDAPSSGQAVVWVVIGKDGTITRSDGGSPPPSPTCT